MANIKLMSSKKEVVGTLATIVLWLSTRHVVHVA